MILKLCPKCRNVYIPYHDRMCSTCQEKYAAAVDTAESRRARNRKYNHERRDPQIVAFYNSGAWENLRLYKLSKDCVCERCKERPAIIAHHIVPVREDWSRRLDYKNLMSVCARCHEELHPDRHKGGGGRGKTKAADRAARSEEKVASD